MRKLKTFTIKIDSDDLANILAALRHFQNAVEAGENLSYLEDYFCDENEMYESDEIDTLIDKING